MAIGPRIGHSRIAREEHARRRVLKDLALRARGKRSRIEVSGAAEDVVLGKIRLPTQSSHQAQVRADAKVVLRIEREILLAKIHAGGVALHEIGGQAEQEIGELVVSHRAVEAERAVFLRLDLELQLAVDPVRAEGELMAAAYEVDVVGDLIGIVVDLGGGAGAAEGLEV